jgi:hypothetical protein
MAVGYLGSHAEYVEGWVVTSRTEPFVIEHGWCEVDGHIVDPSYTPRVNPYGPPIAYFRGMRFTVRQAGLALSRRRLPMAWSYENGAYRNAFEAAWRYAAQSQGHEPRPRTQVVNCRRDACDVFIGRPSKWAGPFFIGRDGTRQELIAKYHDWILRQPGILHDVWSLRGKVLGCDCAPLPCHGDVLAALADFGREDAATSTLAMDRLITSQDEPRGDLFPAISEISVEEIDDADEWPASGWSTQNFVPGRGRSSGGDRTGNSSLGGL